MDNVKTVLVVDDSRVSRMMSRQFILSRHPQWEIHEAANGEEAIQLAQGLEPFLILMDVNMPGMGGMAAAEQLLRHGGEAVMARQWMLPVWESMVRDHSALTAMQRVRLVQVLETSFDANAGAPDTAWLVRIEAAQMENPRDGVLQYLAGVVCMRLSLWGKAQQLLKQSLALKDDSDLRRHAWLALARLAEQRQDGVAATEAYREAAKR